MDRLACEIQIGGKLSRTAQVSQDPPLACSIETSVLEALIGMLYNEGCSHEYGEPPEDIESDADLLEHLNDSGLLQFRHAEKPRGEFEELEGFLRENGIPYRRWSEAKYEYDAEQVIWLPGMDKPFHCIMDQECNEVVKADAVREVLSSLTNERRSLVVRIESAVRQLKPLCPDIPEVPKFEIIP